MECKATLKMIDLYIKKQLNNRELEAFLGHVKNCRECKEELEIYYTVYLALQKLDEERDVSFNIQKMLQDNLAASRRKVQRLKIMWILNYALVMLAEVVLVMVILTQIQAVNIGGFNDTYMYRLVYEKEVGAETELKNHPIGTSDVQKSVDNNDVEPEETENRNGKENSTDRRA